MFHVEPKAAINFLTMEEPKDSSTEWDDIFIVNLISDDESNVESFHASWDCTKKERGVRDLPTKRFKRRG